MEKGVIIKSTGKSYRVLSLHGDKVECIIGGRFRVRDIKTTNPLAVGDNVTYTPPTASSPGIIVDVEERRNYIIRRASNLSREAQIIAANIDNAVVMATLVMPATPVEFLDRFLVTAEAYSIPATIIFNKTDIYSARDLERLAEMESLYRHAGYSTIALSVKEGSNMERVQQLVKEGIALIAGNSGVGKSSLINRLDRSLNIKTAELSRYHKQGRHTTTFPEMYMMPSGGAIIDTPGLRGFGVIDLERGEIYHFFPEIFRLASGCRFHNCLHRDEPGCAVTAALLSGELAATRYRSYLSLLEDSGSKYR